MGIPSASLGVQHTPAAQWVLHAQSYDPEGWGAGAGTVLPGEALRLQNSLAHSGLLTKDSCCVLSDFWPCVGAWAGRPKLSGPLFSPP